MGGRVSTEFGKAGDSAGYQVVDPGYGDPSAGLGLWDQVIALYEPGGAYGAGAMASYYAGMRKSLAEATQSLVSAGLYGTTTTASLAPRYEQEIGVPFRLSLAEQQTQARAQALAGKAGYIAQTYRPPTYAPPVAPTTGVRGWGGGVTGVSYPDRGDPSSILRPFGTGFGSTSYAQPSYAPTPAYTPYTAGPAKIIETSDYWDAYGPYPTPSYVSPYDTGAYDYSAGDYFGRDTYLKYGGGSTSDIMEYIDSLLNWKW